MTIKEILVEATDFRYSDLSHPHYYTSMVDWSRAFGGVPLYLHEMIENGYSDPMPASDFGKARLTRWSTA
jgi:hypothetical protein